MLGISGGNNGLGINSYSGPMGQKEPAYGAGEKLKVATALAPIGSPQALNAPKRAKRAAVKGKQMTAGGQAAQPLSETMAPPGGALPAEPPANTYQEQLQAFWASVAADPGASDQVRELAAKALGNGTA
jgi:hypothetical protein